MEKSINRSDLSVHPPPPGEGLFRFALLKGKNNEKIQTLIDTGAISVVFKDGVEEKLVTVKILEEPIPVSVAGGKDIMASGEWGALILLADDSIENNVLVCLNTKNDLYFSHIYVKIGLF